MKKKRIVQRPSFEPDHFTPAQARAAARRLHERTLRIERKAHKAVGRILKTIHQAEAEFEKRIEDVSTSWSTFVQLQRQIVCAGHQLMVAVTSIGDRKWMAYAVSTPTSVANNRKSPIEVVEAIFDQHAHKVIGEFTTCHKAQREADKYAKRWVAGRVRIAKCGCKEIDLSKSTKRKRS